MNTNNKQPKVAGFGRAMAQAILPKKEQLNSKELEFVLNMSRRDDVSDRQGAWLQNIAERLNVSAKMKQRRFKGKAFSTHVRVKKQKTGRKGIMS